MAVGSALVLSVAVIAAEANAASPWVATPPGHVLLDVFGPASGMPGGRVTNLALGPGNQLHVGTEAGLVRFDGDRFHPLPSPPTEPLPFVMALHVDARGVWVQSRRTLYRIAGDRVDVLEDRPDVSAEVHAAFAAADDGALLLARADGLWRIVDGRLERRVALDGLRARAVHVDAEGAWVGGPEGLFRVVDGRARRVAGIAVRDFQAIDGALYVAAHEGIFRIVDGAPVEVHAHCYATDLALHRGRLAVACGNGIRLAIDGGVISLTSADGLPGEIMTRILSDAEGTLWLGTLSEGLVRIPEPDLRLWNRASGLVTNNATFVTGDGEGGLRVGSRFGLSALGPDLRPRALPLEPWRSRGRQEEVRRYFEVGARRWINVDVGSLYRLEAIGVAHEVPIPDNEIDLELLDDGTIAAVGDHALTLLDGDSALTFPYPPERGSLVGGVPAADGALHFLGEGVHVAFAGGVFRELGPAPPACVQPVMAGDVGVLWAACGGRLWSWERDGWLARADIGDDQPVKAMLADGDEVWVTTLTGLHRLLPDRLSLGPDNGLTGISFLTGSALARSGDWLAALTGQGILFVRPAGLARARPAPAVTIAGIWADDRRLAAPDEIAAGDALLRFDLESESLAGRGRVAYRFRLDGGAWSAAFAEPSLQLPGLAPGDHRLEVEARAWGGDWSPEPAALGFRVPARWFEREDVRLAAILALFLVAFWIWRERNRRLEERLRRLSEREAFREVFGRFVTPEVADEALAGRLSRVGEAREVTVLFADIRGFTPLSESLPADTLVELLNTWLTAMVTEIEAEGGIVNKFMGDAVVAIFGAPRPQDDHADRGLRAAAAMVRAAERLAGAIEARFGRRLRAGIGVNSGPVIAGPIGAASRMEYTVIGETVNVAARVEALTRAVEADVLVTEATVRRLAGRHPLVPAGEHQLKGVSLPVAVWRLDPSGEAEARSA